MNLDHVPAINIAAMFVTLTLSFLVPVLFWILAARRFKRISVAVLAGTVGFILPQMVIRLPILQFLATQESWTNFVSDYRLIALIIYAFTAALFETAGRLLVLKGIMRKRLSYGTVLGTGIGHGGIESIGLIGLTYVNNIIFSFMINHGMASQLEGMESSVRALIDTSPSLFLAAGLERTFTIPFHVFLSVLLGYFIMKNRTLVGSLLCIMIHFSLDFIVAYWAPEAVSIWLIEGLLLIVAVISLLLVVRLKSYYPVIDIEKDPAEVAIEEGYS